MPHYLYGYTPSWHRYALKSDYIIIITYIVDVQTSRMVISHTSSLIATIPERIGKAYPSHTGSHFYHEAHKMLEFDKWHDRERLLVFPWGWI
jgi:hypothetical protein